MMNAFLYATTLLLWGFSWFALSLQKGPVSKTFGVSCRFALASLVLLIVILVKNKGFPRFSWRFHRWFILQGVLMFGLNYLMLYIGSDYVTSGLMAVIFCSAVFFNMTLSRTIFGTPITSQMLLGGTLGIIGIMTVFWPTLAAGKMCLAASYGILYCLLGAFMGSCGDMISASLQKKGVPVLENVFYGMAYGSIFMLGVTLIKGDPMVLDFSFSYVISFLYLSIGASAIAFYTYLTFLGRMGPPKAAYITVGTPIIALTVSSFFEGFEWTYHTFIGMGLVILGNIAILWTPKRTQFKKTGSKNSPAS